MFDIAYQSLKWKQYLVINDCVMDSTLVGLDNFLATQVESWAFNSKIEAEEKLLSVLIEKGLDARIVRGRADYNAGRYRVMTEQSNAEFVADLEGKFKKK